MFEIEKTFTFEAGHSLEHHDGKCRGPHGHSYALTVHLKADSLIKDGPKRNMIVDFSDISKIVKPMIESFLDHKWLNDTLETDSASAEYIAYWVYNYLKPLLPTLYAVSLSETATSKVIYRESTSHLTR